MLKVVLFIADREEEPRELPGLKPWMRCCMSMSIVFPIVFFAFVFWPYIPPLRFWSLLPAFGSFGDYEIDLRLVRITADLNNEREWMNTCRAFLAQAKSSANKVYESKCEANFKDAERRVRKAQRRLDRAIGIGMINGYGKTVARFVQ